jgi:hypothetical protein
MKKLIFFLFFLPLFSFAQDFTDVIEIPGKTADQLYLKSGEWFNVTFNYLRDEVYMSKPDEKKIIEKGNTYVYYFIGKDTVRLDVSFMLWLQFKDGSFVYNIKETELATDEGKIYFYDEFKSLTTKKGLKEYNKTKGIKAGDKQFNENLDAYKVALSEIDNKLHFIIDDLTSYLKEEEDNSN